MKALSPSAPPSGLAASAGRRFDRAHGAMPSVRPGAGEIYKRRQAARRPLLKTPMA